MVKDIRPASKVSSSPEFITQSNGALFFSAMDDSAGRELWKSDGTEAGTMLLKDIRTSGDSDIENLTDVNGTLFFTATDGIHGDELWKSDGTEAGTVLVKDMNPGSAGSNNTSMWRDPMSNFRNANGKLFFIASAGTDNFIYRSDGTEQGTVRITRADYYGLNSLQPTFTGMQDHVYFFNIGDESEGLNLWKLHTNETTPQKVRRFYMPVDYEDSYGYETYEHAMVQCNNRLYIVGRIANHQGFKLIRSDGTSGGTQVITDPYNGTLSSNPSELISVNDVVFFRTRPDPYDYLWAYSEDYTSEELYRTDGTEEGTYKLPGAFQEWNEMTKVGNRLFYTVESSGWELNVSDGTNISNIATDETGETRPFLLTAVGDFLYYTNYLGELWRTNGTATGTVRVRDFTKITSISDVNGKVYALVQTASEGLELWRSNATGSMLKVKTIRSGPAAGSTHILTAAEGNRFYFTANDGIHGNELWKSEGTEATTFMLKDLNQYDPLNHDGKEFDLSDLAIANGQIFLSALDNSNNWMLFQYAAGGASLGQWHYVDGEPQNLKAFNGKVYFVGSHYLFGADANGLIELADLGNGADSVDYAVLDNQLYVALAPWSTNLWRTDGTVCGTIQIPTGASGSFPIEPLGNNMIIGSSEPRIYRNITEITSPCAMESMTAMASEEEIILTPYPNPFVNDFTLRVNGLEDEKANVGVYTASGFPVESFEQVNVNTEYPGIGSAWPKGMYIVKVTRRGNITTHTVVKK
jgi:ELWxxDGT repeat protein